MTKGKSMGVLYAQHGKIHLKHVACPLCGRDDFTVVGKVVNKEGLGMEASNSIRIAPLCVVRCKECGLYYPDPMLFPDDKVVQYMYDEDYFPQKNPWLEAVSQKKWPYDVLDTVEQKLGIKGRLLDLGCGRGNYLMEAIRRGWDAQGIDVSKTNAEMIKNKTGMDIFCGEIKGARYPSNSFDCVLLISVLEHLPEPSPALHEIHRILAPGGLVYLVMPNAESLPCRLADAVRGRIGNSRSSRLSPLSSPFHVIGFSGKTVEYMAQKNRFEVVSLEISGGTYEYKKRARETRVHWRDVAFYFLSWIGHYLGMGLYVTAILKKPKNTFAAESVTI